VALAERHRRFTVEEFHRMVEVGILGERDRVELLEGEIIEMTPIGSRHAACVKRLSRFLTRNVGERAIVGVQDPLRLSATSDEVNPDVTLLHPKEDFYASGHPEPSDVLLVVEVADSSLGYDRGRKSAAYARAGIPELWIVDLEADVVLVRRDSDGRTYRLEEKRGRGARLEVLLLPGVEIGVRDVLPD
jgi:Uma2 family endonuclease